MLFVLLQINLNNLVVSFFNFIIGFIAFCFYECFFTMVIVICNSGFVCRFSEYVFFSKPLFVLGIFKMGFEFNAPVKIFQFFVKRGFTEICLSWNKV